MHNREEEVRGKIPSPSREVLSQWVIDSLNSVDAQHVKNAWNGPGFAYFTADNEEGLRGGDDESSVGDETEG
jgi:hypothetical protein